jgi:hypothetical protein
MRCWRFRGDTGRGVGSKWYGTLEDTAWKAHGKHNENPMVWKSMRNQNRKYQYYEKINPLSVTLEWHLK